MERAQSRGHAYEGSFAFDNAHQVLGDINNVTKQFRDSYNPFEEQPVQKRCHLLYDFASRGNRSKLAKLLELEVDVDSQDLNGNTALHQALENGHTECARLLVSNGADVNTTDARGRTPLWISVEADNPVAVEILLQDGANKEARLEGRTALMEASMRCRMRSLEVLLGKKEVDLDAIDTAGKTALMLAAEAGHCESVQELLTYGASAEIENQMGWTAYKLAAHHKHYAVTEILDQHVDSIPGADRALDLQESEFLESLIPAGIEIVSSNIPEPTKGTGEWMFATKQYLAWLDNAPSVLFLAGGIGCGKSTLMSCFRNGIQKKRGRTLRFGNLCGFFFDDKNTKLVNATVALQGLLSEILAQRHDLLHHALNRYESSKTWTYQSLWAVFENVFSDKSLRSACIFIDALDECEADSRRRLLKDLGDFLKRLSPDGSIKLRIVLSSRPSVQLPTSFTTYASKIDLDRDGNAASLLASDIRLYVQEMIDYMIDEEQWTSRDATKIVDILVHSAGQSFLWISLTLKDLLNSGYTSLADVERFIANCPDDLAGRYCASLRKIDNRRLNDIVRTVNILIAANNPLEVDEFKYLLAVKSTDRSVEDLTLTLENDVRFFLRKFLDDFFRVSESTILVRHQSVKEFFMGTLGSTNGSPSAQSTRSNMEVYTAFRTSIEHANETMAASCVHFLNLEEFDIRKTTDEDKEFRELLPWYGVFDWHGDSDLSPVPQTSDVIKGVNDGPWTQCFRYAAEHWGFHLAACNPSKELVAAALALSTKPNTLINWAHAFDDEWSNNSGKVRYVVRRYHRYNVPPLPEQLDPLMVAVYFGHTSIVASLLTDPLNGKFDDASLGLAITWASRRGHLAIVKMLLESGAKSGSQNERATSALGWAVQGGFTEIVSLLLPQFRDRINIRELRELGDGRHSNLHFAVASEHADIVKLLLKQPNIDVNARNEYNGEIRSCRTPIFALIGSCELSKSGRDIFDMFLRDKRVNLLARDGGGNTLLSRIAECGNIKALKLLLECRERRTDINILLADHDQDPKSRKTPLGYAAEHGHADFIRFFCSTKRVRDPFRWIDQEGANAFHLAARREKVDAIKALADCWPDGVDRADGFCAPLCTAMFAGRNVALARAFLNTGRVDVNKKQWNGRTAVSIAASFGTPELVKVLVEEYRADINIRDNDGKTPLRWANANSTFCAPKMKEAMMKLGAIL